MFYPHPTCIPIANLSATIGVTQLPVAISWLKTVPIDPLNEIKGEMGDMYVGIYKIRGAGS
jgi:hypothetical protein